MGAVGWVGRAVAVAALLVVGWAAVTGWGAIVHGFPLYGPLLVITAVAAVVITLRQEAGDSNRRSRVRTIVRIGLLIMATAWVALMAWLRPLPAVEPALSTLRSDDTVRVVETPTQIVIMPVRTSDRTALFFQPGAKVDARAYAAVLRPVADAGHLVVIAKQPLGIAFLATPVFGQVRDQHPEITRWVIGGHSLGGTVAAGQADDGDDHPVSPVTGLLLYASYPAGDIRSSLSAQVLSISGSEDGLATPTKINASRPDLPENTDFTVIDGAVHAFFGDYGAQRGDGVPRIGHDRARVQISTATVDFVERLAAR